MLNFLAAMLIFAGWFLERRARKRAERERDAALEDARVAWGQREHFMAEAVAADTALMKADRDLREQKAQNLALAERVAQQSELLSRASEREQEAARRLGYLFPRGLETPPSREDALSPTWCREEAMAEKASKLFVAGPDRQYVELTDNQRNQVAIDNLRGEDALPR